MCAQVVCSAQAGAPRKTKLESNSECMSGGVGNGGGVASGGVGGGGSPEKS